MPTVKAVLATIKTASNQLIDTPRRVVFDSFVSAFMVAPIALSGALGRADTPWAVGLGAPLIAILTAGAALAWHRDAELWEALCHPWRRSERMRRIEREERDELDALEAAERAAAEEAEFQRWHRLKRLIGDDRGGREQ